MQSLCDLATQLSVVTARQRLPVQTLTASEHHNVIQRTTHCTVYHCIGADTARGWRSATTKCAARVTQRSSRWALRGIWTAAGRATPETTPSASITCTIGAYFLRPISRGFSPLVCSHYIKRRGIRNTTDGIAHRGDYGTQSLSPPSPSLSPSLSLSLRCGESRQVLILVASRGK